MSLLHYNRIKFIKFSLTLKIPKIGRTMIESISKSIYEQYVALNKVNNTVINIESHDICNGFILPSKEEAEKWWYESK
ncbi:MAG TPA: hypothetical protein VHG34_03810 [Nitrososphaeraceae archaeon]|nr:hypothetical protein [Nitrososphaeraceae archaeon]